MTQLNIDFNKTWHELSGDEQAIFNDDEQTYLQAKKKYDSESKEKENSNVNNNASSQNTSRSGQRANQEKPNNDWTQENSKAKKTIKEMNIIEEEKYDNGEIAFQMLKDNQKTFLIPIENLGFNFEETTEDFNKVLSEKNQIKRVAYNKTNDPELVLKVFKAIMTNERARLSLRYLSTFALGGKYRDDRRAMNKNIIDLLKAEKLHPYGKDNDCGYNGLLKIAPRLISDIRKKTLDKGEHPWDKQIKLQINWYASGFESNFEYNSLLMIGCNPAAINYCYNRLLLQIDLLLKRKSQRDTDVKLLRRLVSFAKQYVVSDYLRDKESTKKIMLEINNLDVNGSDVTFDSFGYM